MNFRKIILASKSPRRSHLLKEAGLDFIVKAKEVEETYPDDMKADEVAEYLAKKKAHASKEFLEEDTILLAADSIVTLGDTIYGKPKDAKHAFEILSALSGTTHKVITGVCLLSVNKEVSFSSISMVQFEALR